MADNTMGQNGAGAPASGSSEWAPGAVPQFADEPAAPPEPEGPRVVSQPGGPDMIQVPVTAAPAGDALPVAPPPVAAPPVAAPPVAAPPVAAPPVVAPPGAPQPVYAQYAPPTYQPAAPPRRKGVPWWVWLIIGGVILIGVLFALAIGLALRQLNADRSPDYSGAPINPTAESQSPATTDPSASGEPIVPGDNTVISETGAVAYDIPDSWVNAGDYIDLSSLDDPLEEGQSIVGTYFTGDPDTEIPQLVLVLESSPSLANRGTFDDQMDEYLKGFATTVDSVGEATRTPVTTANGLEGLQGDFTAAYQSGDAAVRLTIFGNGQRLVFLQWISYSGPIDESAYATFIDSLRVEP